MMSSTKQALPILVLTLNCSSCGKSGEPYEDSCKPQAVAIAHCQVEQYQKNPSRFLLDQQKKYCQQLFPYDICYTE